MKARLRRRAFARPLPCRLSLERLEDRTLLAGNLLIAAEVPGVASYNLKQYTQQGALVNSFPIPPAPGAMEYPDARGLSVDPSGNADIYDGTSTPALATYAPISNSWSFQTVTGWNTVNNISYGSVAAYNHYVFASDMSAGGDANGIVRFDSSGGPAVRFAQGTDFIQVSLGIDGLLYGLVYPSAFGPSVQVYNPDTLALVRSVTFSGGIDSDIRSIAGDLSGQFFTASWGGYIAKYDASGAYRATTHITDNLLSIALDSDGQIAVGGRSGNIYLTNEALPLPQTIQTFQWNVFVTFDHYIGSSAPSPASLTATPGIAQMTLSWPAVPGASSYNLYRATASGAETLLQTGLTSTAFVDVGLVSGTTYYYQVSAVTSGSEGPRSAEVSAAPLFGASTTTLTSTNNPSTFGQSVTFTAKITTTASNGPTPTGTVTFADGAMVLGTAALAGGAATFTTATLGGGTQPIVAFYSGDTNYPASTPALLNQMVGRATPSITLVSSVNPATFGQNVTFTATVTGLPGLPIPTGTVTFENSAAPLGTAPLLGGVASFTISTLPIGNVPINAVYSTDANYFNATTGLTQTTNPASTSVSVISSSNPSILGQQVTFTVTVNAVPPGAGTPTGKVALQDNGSTIAVIVLTAGSGSAGYTFFTAGAHSMTATYTADTNNYLTSTSILSQTVNRRSVATALSSSVNPSTFGQLVTFTVTVTPPDQTFGTPQGSVAFQDGTTLLGTVTLSGGTARFSTTQLGVGSHSITVSYSGDANFAPSISPMLNQTVNLIAISIALQSSLNPSVVGQTTLLTAIVSTPPGASAPTGTVTFLDGLAVLGTGTVLSGPYQATLSVSFSTASSHSLTAVYSGDGTFATSTSSALLQTVNPGQTLTSVSTSVNPAAYGQAVTFTATTVALFPAKGTPTGTVTFWDGAAVLATASLSAGTAQFTTSVLSTGSHIISASYGGDSGFVPSTSGSFTQAVNKLGATVALVSSLNPSTFGQSVTFSITVGPATPGAFVPTGTVTLTDNGSTLAIGTLSGGSFSFTPASLTTGPHPLLANYNGDSIFAANSAQLVQTVNPISTVTTAVSSANPAVISQTVTFTATVSAVAPGTGTPDGIVQILDGGNAIGFGTLSGNTATISKTFSTLGVHSITFKYVGSTNFAASTSGVINETINPAPTVASVQSSVNPSLIGQTATLMATILPAAPASGSPTGTVTFLDGATVLGTGSLISGNSHVVLAVNTLAVGQHIITVSYSGDSNYLASTSPALLQTVNPGQTTTQVTTSVSPSVYGQAVTFTATASAVAPALGTPTGTIAFFDGTTSLGTAPLSGGSARLTISLLAPGNHTITASYAGSASFSGSSSSAITQTVNKDATTTTVVSSLNPSGSGQSVTFTVTLTANAPGSGVPTGSVTFKDGNSTLGTKTLNGSGQATLTISTLKVGTHSITVIYGGDAHFLGSTSAILSQVVSKKAAAPALAATQTSSLNPSASSSNTALANNSPTGPAQAEPNTPVVPKVDSAPHYDARHSKLAAWDDLEMLDRFFTAYTK